MARLFVFGIGGTGSRVIKSLTMLLASGMKLGHFDTVIPMLIDPHKDLNELNECKKLIRLYSKLNERAYNETTEVQEGFFRTKVMNLRSVSSDQSLHDDIEFDERHNEAFGDFINKASIRSLSPSTIDLLSLLYSDKNFDQPLSVGFKGNPHMGSLVLNSIIGGPAYNAFKSTFSSNDRIFIISSVFGGTGAAGFPLLLQHFRQSDKPEIANAHIGALSVMPYFKLSEPGQSSDIDSNDFMTKTKSALTYYSRPEFTSLYNGIYYIADPDKQTEPYENNEKKQDNKAHVVELLGALSIFHFAENNLPRGSVNEYCISDDEDVVTFQNVGNSSKDRMGINLTSLHLLSLIHPLIRDKAKEISFCKANNFDTQFFNDSFFSDPETGFEKFFQDYYRPWIKQLHENERTFSPFDLRSTKSFYSLVNGKQFRTEKHVFDGKIKRPSDISDLLNRIALTANRKQNKQLNHSFKVCQYLQMCQQGTQSYINSKIKITENA